HGLVPAPPYMSQWLTQALWLGGWLALLRWRNEERLWHLMLLALTVGWCAITRPLTAFAFALPAAIVVVPLALRRRQLGQVAAAAAVGTLVLALLPIWSYEVTGDAKTSPLVLSVRATTPYDQLGVGRRVLAPL